MNDTDRLAEALADNDEAIKALTEAVIDRDAAEAKVRRLRGAIQEFFSAPWWPGNYDMLRQAMKETSDGSTPSANGPARRNGTDAVED